MSALSAFQFLQYKSRTRRCAYLCGMLLSITTLFALPVRAADAPVTESSSLPWVEARSEAVPPLQSGQFVFQFTGAGGFYLGDASIAILVDPFFSNPGLWKVVSLRELQSDTATIDRHLPPVDKVRALLVGHGHYDHAMDIPYVFSKLPQEARLLGSETLNNQVASSVPPLRRVNVEPAMAKDLKGGSWIFVTPRLRVMPIASEHSPHVGRWVFAGGKMRDALDQLPADSLDWKAGKTISYLVDFLDDGGRVNYRVFVQTSSSNPPKGIPPPEVLADGYSVNVAVICAANYTSVDEYPETLLAALKPREVVIVHWEKFWEAWQANMATPLPGLDLEELHHRIRSAAPQASVHLPQRGAQFLLNAAQPTGGHAHGK